MFRLGYYCVTRSYRYQDMIVWADLFHVSLINIATVRETTARSYVWGNRGSRLGKIGTCFYDKKLSYRRKRESEMGKGGRDRQTDRQSASNIALSYAAKGISICWTVYAWITSVTDRLADGQTAAEIRFLHESHIVLISPFRSNRERRLTFTR